MGKNNMNPDETPGYQVFYQFSWSVSSYIHATVLLACPTHFCLNFIMESAKSYTWSDHLYFNRDVFPKILRVLEKSGSFAMSKQSRTRSEGSYI